MKTYFIVLTPFLLVILVKFLISPNWLNDWSYMQTLILGAAIGLFFGVAARLFNEE